MKKVCLLFAAFLFLSCKKEKKQNEPTQPPDCNAIAILFSANVKPAAECTNEGRIEIITSSNSNYLFKLNNGNFQSTALFENLTPGKYAVSVKSKEGCIKNRQHQCWYYCSNSGPAFYRS